MPLYEYLCPKCNSRFEEIKRIDERHYSVCPQCGAKGRIAIPRGKAPGLSFFREGYYEHLQPEPIYCRTPQDLRNACDRLGKISDYLENSQFRTSPGPDYDPAKDPTRAPAPDLLHGQNDGG